MTKVSLVVVIWIWHCVVNGQFPVNNFNHYDPYNYYPYTSTFVDQPNGQRTAGSAAQLGGIGEKNSLFQGAIFLQIKRLEASAASLAKQLSNTQQIVSDLTAALKEKAAISDLNKTKQDVSDLTSQKKAVKSDVEQTKKDVTALTNQLNEKAKQSDLEQTNKDVTALTTQVNDKALKSELEKTNNAVSNLNVITSATSIGTIPSSCGDLKNIGYVKSGIYSVMEDKKVKNVYCDFTKSNNADFQKLIGVVDVKSTAVYFQAQLSKIFSTLGTAVPFDAIKPNVGNALSASGEFTAPTPGKYYFAYSGLSDSGAIARVVLQTKSGTGAWTRVGEGYGSASYQTFTFHSTLELKKGDQVRLSLTDGRIHETSSTYTSFVGWLIEENELTV